ncbi:MAG: DUF1592 domain-containing protein [Vicinamibacterales bacterium]
MKNVRTLFAVTTAVWMLALWSVPSAQGPAPAQAPAQPSAAAPDSASVRGVVDRYCVTCHNSRTRTAGLALDAVDKDNLPANAEIWEKVIRKVRGNMMPPAGMPRPEPAVLAGFVAGLERTLDQAAARDPKPGRKLLHRFNRAEYQNAIRDLLAVEIDAASILPPDDSSFGFDNIADILGISPLLMERYIGAAEKISALAVGDVSQPVTATLHRVRHDLPQGEQIPGLPAGTRGGTLFTHNFPLDGEYVIKVRLWRTSVGFTRGLQREHDLEVSLDGVPALQTTVGGRSDYELSVLNAAAIDASLDRRLRARVRVTAGPHDVLATFLAIAGGVTTGPEALRPSMFAVDPLYIHGVPGIESVTIEGPFNPEPPKDTPSRRAIFTCAPSGADDPRCARTILSRLARRAYRRPVTDEDLRPLLEMYRTGSRDGGFEPGIQLALQGILTSPHFLFRIEQDPANLRADVYQVPDLDLATRLSFFLWSSIPDESLLDAAARGQLRRAAVLEREVRRLLADPRSSALVENFAGQWLHLRNLAAFVPDRTDFPEFDDLLRQAMRRETELFVASLIADDRSALDLLQADYTFMNERLARHYGVNNVYGSAFRRVPVTDPARRGLLGHASVLAVTSYPNRTSPVLRGKWILENVLGTPPSPPPPDLSNVLPDTVKPTTMKERMAAHRRNAVCASCHKVMDPLGFALENFDATGAWRIKDGEQRIDPADTLADGTPIDGPVALRQALLANRDQFVSTLTEKLLTYALGRGLTAADMPAVRTIVRDAKAQDYRMSAIVLGIARSVPFQMRARAQGTTATN